MIDDYVKDNNNIC